LRVPDERPCPTILDLDASSTDSEMKDHPPLNRTSYTNGESKESSTSYVEDTLFVPLEPLEDYEEMFYITLNSELWSGQ